MTPLYSPNNPWAAMSRVCLLAVSLTWMTLLLRSSTFRHLLPPSSGDGLVFGPHCSERHFSLHHWDAQVTRNSWSFNEHRFCGQARMWLATFSDVECQFDIPLAMSVPRPPWAKTKYTGSRHRNTFLGAPASEKAHMRRRIVDSFHCIHFYWSVKPLHS